MRSNENINSIIGSPRKAINKLAFPTIFSMLLMFLNNLIDSFWVAGINADALAAAQKVYNNTNATPAELEEAAKTLKEAINAANFDNASVERPFEMLAMLGTVEQTFTNGDTKGWTSTTIAQNKQANNGNAAADYNATGNHYENWHPSAFGTGRIYASLTDIPNGVYRLKALAFANETGDTYLYAGKYKNLVEKMILLY